MLRLAVGSGFGISRCRVDAVSFVIGASVAGAAGSPILAFCRSLLVQPLADRRPS